VAIDIFLICRNCINWGQPWMLAGKKTVCELRHDGQGHPYTFLHPACRHFVPVQGRLPESLQRMRLFVQTLSPSQKSHFAWALAQSSLLLKLRDSKGRNIALGDHVEFRLGLLGHTGTVEGADTQDPKAAVVNSPAFIGGCLSVPASSLTLCGKEQEPEGLPDDKKTWHIGCLVKEISLLRARQLTWTPEDRRACLLYERQLQGLDPDALQNTLFDMEIKC
jgi:hypothetical protein